MIRLALNLDLIAFGIVAALLVIRINRQRREHDRALEREIARRYRLYEGQL